MKKFVSIFLAFLSFHNICLGGEFTPKLSKYPYKSPGACQKAFDAPCFHYFLEFSDASGKIDNSCKFALGVAVDPPQPTGFKIGSVEDLKVTFLRSSIFVVKYEEAGGGNYTGTTSIVGSTGKTGCRAFFRKSSGSRSHMSAAESGYVDVTYYTDAANPKILVEVETSARSYLVKNVQEEENIVALSYYQIESGGELKGLKGGPIFATYGDKALTVGEITKRANIPLAELKKLNPKLDLKGQIRTPVIIGITSTPTMPFFKVEEDPEFVGAPPVDGELLINWRGD